MTATSDTAPPPSRRTRLAAWMLRAPSRVHPIPGWFPLVVEPVHRGLEIREARVIHEVDGIRMALDLNDYVQRRIFYSAFEQHEVALMRRLLRPGDAVIDVGANVGFITLVASDCVGPRGEVHAFEPVPVNRDALMLNLSLNGVANVRANASAVAETKGTMTLGLVDFADAENARGRSGTSGSYSEGQALRQVTAPVVDLDSYIRDNAIDRPIRLVKIDVEGVEPRVLAGMKETLAERPPDALVVEINRRTLSEHGYSATDVLDPLSAAGYALNQVSSLGRLRPLRAKTGRRSGLVNVVALRPGIRP